MKPWHDKNADLSWCNMSSAIQSLSLMSWQPEHRQCQAIYLLHHYRSCQ